MSFWRPPFIIDTKDIVAIVDRLGVAIDAAIESTDAG